MELSEYLKTDDLCWYQYGFLKVVHKIFHTYPNTYPNPKTKTTWPELVINCTICDAKTNEQNPDNNV